MASLVERAVGAAMLNVPTYEEVEADTTALGQAMTVVVVAAVAAGVGMIGQRGIAGLVAGTLGALIGWFIWALLTWVIGTKLMPEPETQADLGQLLRTIGFASAPGVLRVAGIIPFVGWVINLVASVWMLVAMVVAVRQALDYKSTGRAVLVCLIGFVVYLVFAVGVGIVLGILAAVASSVRG